MADRTFNCDTCGDETLVAKAGHVPGNPDRGICGPCADGLTAPIHIEQWLEEALAVYKRAKLPPGHEQAVDPVEWGVISVRLISTLRSLCFSVESLANRAAAISERD